MTVFSGAIVQIAASGSVRKVRRSIRSVPYPSIREGASIIGNQDAVDGKRKCHGPATAAVDWVTDNQARRGRLRGLIAVAAVIVRNIGSRCYRKYVGRYHNGTKTKNAEYDQQHIHEKLIPSG
jgi:hypothetical protein